MRALEMTQSQMTCDGCDWALGALCAKCWEGLQDGGRGAEQGGFPEEVALGPGTEE